MPSDFSRQALDFLPSKVAVLSLNGTLIIANKEWKDSFSGNRGFAIEKTDPGANFLVSLREYLSVNQNEGLENILNDLQSMLDGKLNKCEATYSWLSGNDILWFRMTMEKFPEGIFVLDTDITKSRKNEDLLNAARSRLAGFRKSEMIGTLAGGVLHEINNLVMGMINYAQLIYDKLENEDRLKKFALGIMEAGERMNKVLSNFLILDQPSGNSREKVSIPEALNSSILLVRHLLNKSFITVAKEEEVLPEYFCNRQEILEVFLNFLMNAAHSLDVHFPGHHENKIIRISLKNETTAGLPVIQIIFKIEGSGFNKAGPGEKLGSFFTLNGDSGSNPDFSPINKIIQNYGGSVVVDGEENLFTRFTINLPVDSPRH